MKLTIIVENIKKVLFTDNGMGVKVIHFGFHNI